MSTYGLPLSRINAAYLDRVEGKDVRDATH